MPSILGLPLGGGRCLKRATMWHAVIYVPRILFVGFMVATPALAQQPTTLGLSPAETLNEQQLQSLSPMPGNCAGAAAGAPRSLQEFVERNQVNGGSSAASDCGGSEAEQAIPAGWTLVAGELVGQQLASWGQSVGWHVVWNYNEDWTVPSSVTFQGNFSAAASQVLDDLASEGALIHGVFYQGNHTLVITGGGQ